LANGRTLRAAVEAALAQDPMLDAALALRRLFGEGLVVGFTLAPPPNPVQG
jgi:hypothetical protein